MAKIINIELLNNNFLLNFQQIEWEGTLSCHRPQYSLQITEWIQREVNIRSDSSQDGHTEWPYNKQLCGIRGVTVSVSLQNKDFKNINFIDINTGVKQDHMESKG